MERFWANTGNGKRETGNVSARRSRSLISILGMCEDGADQVVEQLRLRGHVAVRVGVDVPGSQLVQRSRFLVGEVQHVTVRVHVLHLTYEEATALHELAAWNVHTDTDGNVTPESQLFDDLVRTILTHPEY